MAHYSPFFTIPIIKKECFQRKPFYISLLNLFRLLQSKTVQSLDIEPLNNLY